MLRRLVAFTGLILLIGVAVWGFLTVRSFNHFEDVASSFDGSCDVVSGIAGPEDIQIDFKTRKAFISSHDRRAKIDNTSEGRGSIFLFDIINPLSGTSWHDRTNGMPEEFEPLGLYFYEEGDVRRLFVVNGAKNTIELYNVSLDGNLKHLESFSERRLTSPKDVVATGPRSFYVTNDKNAGRSSLRGQVDFIFRRRTGAIFYFNGTSWHKASEHIRYANGININKDGSELYVAETAGENLIKYNRDVKTGYLVLDRRIHTGAAVDNINIDQDGIFWIGAHPQPIALARHRQDPANLAPSKVFSYNPFSDELKTVYSDNGSSLSGSSSAAKINRKLIIGSLYEEKFLLCNMAFNEKE